MKYMKWVLFDSKTTLKHSETTKRVKRIQTGHCNWNLFVNLFVQEGDELQRAHASRCKAMQGDARTRSPISLVVCHVKLDEVHIDHIGHGCHGLSSIFPHRSSLSSLLPSFKQLFVSFPWCSHLRCCIDRVMRHQEETLHSIKGCCILLYNARCKKRWFDHSDIFRLYFLQARTIRTGILPRSIVPFTGAKTSKLFETPIGIRGTKSRKRNRGYQYVSICFACTQCTASPDISCLIGEDRVHREASELQCTRPGQAKMSPRDTVSQLLSDLSDVRSR